jgi:hypothetical protein
VTIHFLIASAALWVVVLFSGFLLLGALRGLALLRWQIAQLEAITPSRVSRGGPRPGTNAPEFTLPLIAGGSGGADVRLEHYAGRELLIVFMLPGCGPRHGIVPELNRIRDGGELQVPAIPNGDTRAAHPA